MSTRRKRNIQGWPVMKYQCQSCPFGPNGDRRVLEGVVARIVQMQASQICHHPSLAGKKETHLCRGARDLQLRVLTQFGFLPEPTDEAFDAKKKELGL